ncbi:prepilin peptidase [Leifsonia sp. NPDC058248]|uniref:prepilin peptidase n=1 Tax=Leifsonia sp. NPDC058248 TaxID=3346402 RepID=UPI0036DEC4D4
MGEHDGGIGLCGPVRAPRWRVWGMLATALALVGIALVGVAVVGAAVFGGGVDPPRLAGVAYVAAVTGPLWVTDARERRLPNPLVMPGYAFAAVGLGWQWLARGSPPWQALACCAATLVAFVVVAATGGLGMGDAKLAGLLALVLGGFGGGLSVVLAFGVAFVGAGAAAFCTMRHPDARRGDDVPLGPFLLTGFWFAGIWLAGF